MVVYVVRAVWIAAHLLCLFAIDSACLKYRWWAAYVFLSSLVSVLYWPEVPGWELGFQGLLLSVLLLRTLACLEALHWQTCEFPWWSRMMAGSYLFCAGIVCCLSLMRDDRWAGLYIEYRRYLQIWTFLVMGVVEMLLLSIGWWKAKRNDWHAAAVLALAANHARVSVLSMAFHPAGQAWQESNWVAMAVDAGILLVWALIIDRTRPATRRAGIVDAQARQAA